VRRTELAPVIEEKDTTIAALGLGDDEHGPSRG